MRTSSRKTTTAVLRDIIGIKVPEWAEMLNRSPHTVHDLEARGRLKLSATLAQKMNYETGISIKWLMDGDPTSPPVTAAGEPFTRKIFEQVQARKKNFATAKHEDVRSTVLDVLHAVCGILTSANRKRKYHLAVYRMAKALAELRDEFGEAKDFDGLDKVLAYLRPFVPRSADTRESVRRIQQKLRNNAPTNVVDLSRSPKPKSKQPLKKRRRR